MRDTDQDRKPSRQTPSQENLDGQPRFVGPVVPDSPIAGSAFQRLAIIPFLVVALFAIWAISNLRMDRAEHDRVAFVEQTLNPDDSLRRFEAPPVLVKNRANGNGTRAESPAAGEVASVDLMSPPGDAQDAGQAKSASVLPVNLDYSRRKIAAMSETELKKALAKLDTQLAELQPLAERTQQNLGFKVLEERFDGLDNLARAIKSPMPKEQLLDLTRQSMELRDEMVGFESQLKSLASVKSP